jgi:cell fate regulator YaaT (PSP1 superfamily)
MCCLAYEVGTYSELKKDMPKVGKRVVTPKGPGKVTQQNIINRKLKVALDNGEEAEVGFDEIREESFFDRVRKGK